MKILITILIAVSALNIAVFNKAIYASTSSQTIVCGGVALVSGSGCDHTSSGSTLDNTLKLVLNLISAIAGLIAVFAIIVGGLKYVNSGGASDRIDQAKNTILYAVVGIIIVVLAQVIVKFVLNKATGL